MPEDEVIKGIPHIIREFPPLGFLGKCSCVYGLLREKGIDAENGGQCGVLPTESVTGGGGFLRGIVHCLRMTAYRAAEKAETEKNSPQQNG